MTFKEFGTNLFITLFLFTSSTPLIAQKENSVESKEFKILVEKTDTGIKMKSLQGSAWINLSFSLTNNQPQAVDENGMTELDKVSSCAEENLADFLFTVTKTKNEFIFKGIQGTVWTDLSFYLAEKEKRIIDRFGMTETN